MGSGGKKKNEYDMGNYICSDKEREAWMWCVRNNIKISPKATSTISWSILIDINGKINKSPESYNKDIIWKKLYEFCLYYYNKYHSIPKQEQPVKKINTKKDNIEINELKLF